MNSIFVVSFSQMNAFVLLDVTESGTRPGWFDADCYKLACLLGCVGSKGQRFLKSRPVGNDMIGGQDDHDGSVIADCHPASAEGDCRRGVTLSRFCYDI